jgi:hypothetical protein
MISANTKIPIHYEEIGALMGSETKTLELFHDQIKGCRVYNHVIAKGDTIHFAKEQNGHHILVLVTGTASFLMEGALYQFSVRTCFVPGLDQPLDVRGETDVQILEIFWEMKPEDYEEMKGYFTSLFPKIQLYKDSMQYHDSAKSWKTINRIFLEQGNIPRFAMGSVESYGPDAVQQHPHPQIDQFFYSFPENDMDLMIDDDKFTQKGNVIVHIPLGSNHGVDVPDGRRMHYLWIDFWVDPKVDQMLAKGHVKTGLKRDFTNEGYSDGK